MTDTQRKLAANNIKLAYYLARKWNAKLDSRFELSDLISACMIGLVKAAQKFDPKRGNTFSTYACRCADNEVLMHIRAINKSLKNGIYPVNFSDTELKDKDGSLTKLPSLIASMAEQCKSEFIIDLLWLKENMQKLKPIEARCLKLYYFKDLNQSEIADILKISQSYVSRIIQRGISELRYNYKQAELA